MARQDIPDNHFAVRKDPGTPDNPKTYPPDPFWKPVYSLVQQSFLGASIVNFSVNLGFNSNSSSLNVNLVEDDLQDYTELWNPEDVYLRSGTKHGVYYEKCSDGYEGCEDTYPRHGRRDAVTEGYHAWSRKAFPKRLVEKLGYPDYLYKRGDVKGDILYSPYPGEPVYFKYYEREWITDPDEFKDGECSEGGHNSEEDCIAAGKTWTWNQQLEFKDVLKFEFNGILKSFKRAHGTSGINYTVDVEDPRALLEGTQVILSDYAGPVAPADGSYDVVVSPPNRTYSAGYLGYYNVVNLFGYLEAVGFGNSETTDDGISWYDRTVPATDTGAPTVEDWYTSSDPKVRRKMFPGKPLRPGFFNKDENTGAYYHWGGILPALNVILGGSFADFTLDGMPDNAYDRNERFGGPLYYTVDTRKLEDSGNNKYVTPDPFGFRTKGRQGDKAGFKHQAEFNSVLQPDPDYRYDSVHRYAVDLSGLYVLHQDWGGPLPSDFKVSGEQMSLLSLIQSICEAAGADFFVTLEAPKPKDPNEAPGEPLVSPDGFQRRQHAGTIKVTPILRNAPVTFGLIEREISNATRLPQDGGSTGYWADRVQSADVGYEFNDDVAGVFMLGAPRTRVVGVTPLGKEKVRPEFTGPAGNLYTIQPEGGEAITIQTPNIGAAGADMYTERTPTTDLDGVTFRKGYTKDFSQDKTETFGCTDSNIANEEACIVSGKCSLVQYNDFTECLEHQGYWTWNSWKPGVNNDVYKAWQNEIQSPSNMYELNSPFIGPCDGKNHEGKPIEAKTRKECNRKGRCVKKADQNVSAGNQKNRLDCVQDDKNVWLQGNWDNNQGDGWIDIFPVWGFHKRAVYAGSEVDGFVQTEITGNPIKGLHSGDDPYRDFDPEEGLEGIQSFYNPEQGFCTDPVGKNCPNCPRGRCKTGPVTVGKTEDELNECGPQGSCKILIEGPPPFGGEQTVVTNSEADCEAAAAAVVPNTTTGTGTATVVSFTLTGPGCSPAECEAATGYWQGPRDKELFDAVGGGIKRFPVKSPAIASNHMSNTRGYCELPVDKGGLGGRWFRECEGSASRFDDDTLSGFQDDGHCDSTYHNPVTGTILTCHSKRLCVTATADGGCGSTWSDGDKDFMPLTPCKYAKELGGERESEVGVFDSTGNITKHKASKLGMTSREVEKKGLCIETYSDDQYGITPHLIQHPEIVNEASCELSGTTYYWDARRGLHQRPRSATIPIDLGIIGYNHGPSNQNGDFSHIYFATVTELRVAAVNEEGWLKYLKANDPFLPCVMGWSAGCPDIKQKTEDGVEQQNQALSILAGGAGATPPPIASVSTSAATIAAANCDVPCDSGRTALKPGERTKMEQNHAWKAVNEIATQFYGRKFLMPLPFHPPRDFACSNPTITDGIECETNGHEWGALGKMTEWYRKVGRGVCTVFTEYVANLAVTEAVRKATCENTFKGQWIEPLQEELKWDTANEGWPSVEILSGDKYDTRYPQNANFFTQGGNLETFVTYPTVEKQRLSKRLIKLNFRDIDPENLHHTPQIAPLSGPVTLGEGSGSKGKTYVKASVDPKTYWLWTRSEVEIDKAERYYHMCCYGPNKDKKDGVCRDDKGDILLLAGGEPLADNKDDCTDLGMNWYPNKSHSVKWEVTTKEDCLEEDDEGNDWRGCPVSSSMIKPYALITVQNPPRYDEPDFHTFYNPWVDDHLPTTVGTMIGRHAGTLLNRAYNLGRSAFNRAAAMMGWNRRSSASSTATNPGGRSDNQALCIPLVRTFNTNRAIASAQERSAIAGLLENSDELPGAMSDLLRTEMVDAAFAPWAAGVPQQSNRYKWGPWALGAGFGKAELINSDQYHPAAFGSEMMMNYSALSKCISNLHPMQTIESGTVTLTGLPEYTLGGQMSLGESKSGPYITDISVDIGDGGLTTRYTMKTQRKFANLQEIYEKRIRDTTKAVIDSQKKIANMTKQSRLPNPQDYREDKK